MSKGSPIVIIDMYINMTTVISKHFGTSIFIDSFASKWPGLKDFFWFFEMEELGASEAQKNEILNYEALIILKANNDFL